MTRRPRKDLADLAALAALDRAGCVARWREVFGMDPPRYLSSVFIAKALAYELQCRMQGGLSPKVRRTLKAMASAKGEAAPVNLSPGTHLVQEWNGRTWRVEVQDDGFHCNGRCYRSLSAIAREITGARWSGPRFFGVS
ncbi:MAG: DUF2924 domain-containing protein [Sphingomonadales bacterium]